MHRVINADVLKGLRQIPDNVIDCIVTSPPYYSLRDYGVQGQIGCEPTFAEFLAKLVEVFEECRRVLKPTGTMWINMGDSAADGSKFGGSTSGKHAKGLHGKTKVGRAKRATGLAPKNIIGQPWRLAFALQDAGWILRQDIIWEKPSCMPESCKDRPTRSHEYIFLFVKSPRYWYDAAAIAEPLASSSKERLAQPNLEHQAGSDRGNGGTKVMKAVGGWRKSPRKFGSRGGQSHGQEDRIYSDTSETRNARSVWTIPSKPYKRAHFATFPPEIPRRCILAGCPPGGIVLDIFAGSGTTLAVGIELGRRVVGIEISTSYCEDLIRDRLRKTQPPLALEESA